MSATGAPASAQAEVVEQVAEAPVAAEAATDVEVEREEVVEVAPEGASGTLTPALSQREREMVAARIRAGAGLPPALRDCFARVVEASAEAAADGTVRVPIEEAVRAVEEALPEFLRPDRGEKVRAEHPAGDVFFHGDPAELSDADAEEIARGQLARSGLLRGQKVRAAE